MDILEFSFARLLLVAFITIIVFSWIRKANFKCKLYYIPFVSFIFIYSGIGYGWATCNNNYLILYTIYILIFSLTCRYYSRRTKYPSLHKEYFINILINNYGHKLIIGYIFICILELASIGKISNLWSPPTMTDEFSSFNWDINKGGVSQLLYYLKEIFYIFYILSLYRYRNNTKKLLLYILFPFYITYVTNAYLARGAVMAFLLLIFVNYCLTHPQYRKKIIIATILGVPVVLYILSVYTYVRMGVEFEETFTFALKLLAFQETKYPIHYEDIIRNGFNGDIFRTYVEWIATLPLPGFLSPFNSDYAFTARFSEMILGISRTSIGFNILLPGVVGEGAFIMGFFYPIHAFLFAYIISFVYKNLQLKQEIFLLMYYGIYAAFVIARGGTVSMYPFYFKHFILYLLFVYYFKRTIASGK